MAQTQGEGMVGKAEADAANAPDATGFPNQHMSPQQRAGELTYYLQQAQQEARADISRTEDENAKMLFGEIADLLTRGIQALEQFQGGNDQARIIQQ